MLPTITVKQLIWLLLSGLLVGLFVLHILMGPPQLLAFSESPVFCNSCHLHNDQYDSWFHSVHRGNARCVDCHLPNDTIVNHFFWKSVEGVRDPFLWFTNQLSDDLKASEHQETVIQANCIRCHEQQTSMINQERECWDCHKQVVHGKMRHH